MARRHDLLLSWIDEPSRDGGVRFARASDEWEFWSYDRLSDLVRRTADAVVAAGVGPDSVVSLIQRSGPHFVGSLFGVMLAGATPSPLAPPMAFQHPDIYDEHVAGAFKSLRPRCVLVDDDLVSRIEPIAARSDTAIVSVEALLADVAERDTRRSPADAALVQFTSGSSGRARGIRVSAAALTANLGAIHEWLGMTRDDATATWLPVHHDMGLIGCLLAPIVLQGDIWLLQPEQFLRSPLRYLRCFGAGPARLTAMPTFGLEHIVRRVRPDAVRDLDFSEWRTLIVGAERVDVRVLESFHALLGPAGFRRRIFAPAYGLAEATLAVTGLPMEEEPAVRAATPGLGQDDLAVGCGVPLRGVTVTIERDDGTDASDGEIGQIIVAGASVADGYVSNASSTSMTRFEGRVLQTGDAGYVEDGQLYVVGRIGDSIKVRGKAVFAEDVEVALRSAGIPAARAAVLLGHVGDVPTAVALLEQPTDEWKAHAGATLRTRVDTARVVVIDAPRRTIERTSSGKPKRRVLWQSYVNGSLPGKVS